VEVIKAGEVCVRCKRDIDMVVKPDEKRTEEETATDSKKQDDHSDL
jgi:hypothetical protein